MRKLSDSRQLGPILTAVTIIMILALLLVLSAFSDRVTSNPPGTVGNTAGNLNNGGYFCEDGGTVYFSNAYDEGTLYSMDVDEKNFKKLGTAKVCNILAGGDYLYYFQLGVSGDAGLGNIRSPRSFNRCKRNGKNVTALTRDTIVTGQLVDDTLYLLAAGDKQPFFYKMKTDKSDRVDLADYTVNPACAVNGTIYYNGTGNDHYLYALDTTTDVSREVWAGNLWYPALEGDHIYYLDVENNYRLCRYSLSQQVIEVLTHDRVDCFNVGSGFIYYQKNGTSPQLICMRTDGTDARAVADGNYTDICLTSRYVYFREFGKEDTLYHSPLGAGYAEPFLKALEAAPAK